MRRRDYLSALIGLVVFFVGVGLILFAFKLAFDLFQVSPGVAVGVTGAKEVNLNTTISSVLEIIVRIILLVIMAGFGSMIANRGIRLYSSGGDIETPKPAKPAEVPAEDA